MAHLADIECMSDKVRYMYFMSIFFFATVSLSRKLTVFKKIGKVILTIYNISVYCN